MDGHNTSNISDLLRPAMKDRGLSMRALGRASGLGASTISRVMSGKQALGMLHLQAFSRHLGIPMQELLRAAGFVGAPEHPVTDNDRQLPSILSELLDSFGIDLDALTGQIDRDLIKYRQYAATPEGDLMIRRCFPDKIEAVGGCGIVAEKLRHYFNRYCDADTVPENRLLYGGLLLYFVLSADVIPDYLLPFGYLDDAIALYLSEAQLAPKESGASG